MANDGSNQEAHGRFIIRSGNFYNQSIERLRIDSSGRVLIGGDSQVGVARLLVYSDSRLHPAIKADCIDGGVNRANGFTMLADNYGADESLSLIHI